MEITKVHCLFEQSGTFKREFLNLGITAEDYDILDDFGETDNRRDLFAEIEMAYDGKPSMFDDIKTSDLILAFFPCTRFEAIIPLQFRGEGIQQKNWSDAKKLEYSLKLHGELSRLYSLICKLFAVCLRGGYRLIVENPYTQPHYLTEFFPVKPKLIIKDRTTDGDYYKKPTQFWFVNCEPEKNFLFEPLEYVRQMTINGASAQDGISRQVRRSLIHPQFARRFIKSYIVTEENT